MLYVDINIAFQDVYSMYWESIAYRAVTIKKRNGIFHLYLLLFYCEGKG